MPRPVLLVPGFLDGPGSFRALARHLRHEGLDARPIRLTPRLATCSLHHFAQQLAAEVERAAPEASSEVDLVGFSMGGIVSRLYVQRHGGAPRVRRLVTLASPHAGSHVARIMPQEAAREMRPGSALLADLARDAAEAVASVDVTALWTPYDLTVLPGASGDWRVGASERMPVLAHRLMLHDRRVMERVTEVLRDEG